MSAIRRRFGPPSLVPKSWTLLRKLANRLGVELMLRNDMRETEFEEILGRCQRFTMTSMERMYALFKSTDYVVKSKIEGSLVEAGVWRGGSSMLMAQTLLNRHERTRDMYLYDTFEGMPEPGECDVEAFTGRVAHDQWTKDKRVGYNDWLYAPIETVKRNMSSTGYPVEHLHFVKGRVEETIPGSAPDRIAILRLDTDFYSSTIWELSHLFPRLVPGGVLIVDDFGYWKGARAAVDEYLERNKINILLNRVDQTCRIGVKT